MDNFIPPFCPYKDCECHTFPNPAKWWIGYGSHTSKLFGKVHRFRCKKCERTFSSQTFSLDYFVKRLIDFHRVEYLISSSMSIRALSRELSCSCDSVLNRVDRLSRQGIALHSFLRRLAKPREAVCFDGLVSFDRSQYFPNDIGLSITAQSRFILGMTHVTTKRSGCQTAKQKEKSKILYKKLSFEKKGID